MHIAPPLTPFFFQVFVATPDLIPDILLAHKYLFIFNPSAPSSGQRMLLHDSPPPAAILSSPTLVRQLPHLPHR